MLQFLNANQKDFLKKLELVLNTRKLKQFNKSSLVKKILSDVKKGGDKAVVNYEKKFSKIKTKANKIKFSKAEINKISKKIDIKLKKSIDLAFIRIKKFHTKQKFSTFKYKDNFQNELSY